MININITLKTGEGYFNLQRFIPKYLILNFKNRLSELKPLRASS